ncbi:MAG: hypothetical protein JXP34_25275 [Planctomycetes bacterium]|nr:hypothetical protein [Planctomycetota bacterium]
MMDPDRPEEAERHLPSLVERIVAHLRPDGQYALDSRKIELRPGEARRVLQELAHFRYEHFSYKRFLEKLAHILGMAQDERRSQEERNLLLGSAGFFLSGIGRALHEPGGDGRVLGYSGELSGIFEIAAKRGTVFQAIDIRGDENGDIRALESVDIPVLDEEGQTVKEFDAVSHNAVFEFKFHATLKKLYQQVLGVGSRRPHIDLLARDPRFRRIRNLVYFGERAGGRGEIVRAIAAFAGREGISVERSERGGIAVRLPIDVFRRFIQDPGTLRLLRTEALGLADTWRWGVDLDRLGSSGELERVDALLGELEEVHAGEDDKFEVIIAISNCPRSQPGCDVPA